MYYRFLQLDMKRLQLRLSAFMDKLCVSFVPMELFWGAGIWSNALVALSPGWRRMPKLLGSKGSLPKVPLQLHICQSL